MSINAINSANQAATAAAAGTTTSGASKDEFLKLLVAQLQNQDPLNPQDGAEFVAQLAQFSAIELSAEANERLAGLQAGQDTLSRAALTDVVGKNIRASADNIRVGEDGGQPTPLIVNLSSAASKVEVIITDEAGNEVNRINMGAHQSGDKKLDWPGTDKSGAPLPPGNYQIKVEASTTDGGTIDASASLYGTVQALEFRGGEVMFQLGSVLVAPGSVQSIEPSN